MKRYNKIFLCACTILFAGACTNDGESDLVTDEKVKIEALQISLAGLDADVSTKAVSEYAVNTSADPTRTMTGRETWLLDVVVYNGNTPYADGSGTFTPNADGIHWDSPGSVYFPNYTRQQVTAKLYPPGWTTTTGISTVQNTIAAILQQDILAQNDTPTITVLPAHIPKLDIWHANSMLDFKFNGIDDTEIDSVRVEVGGKTYQPYKAKSGANAEYMVIIPVGSSDPVIRVYTARGARYYQDMTDIITNTPVNACYCFTLEGLELLLSEITISEWTTGPGVSGEYITEVSYPTFRGKPDTGITIYYDNGLEQSILFNDQGEATEKPAGRTIIAIRPSGGVRVEIDPPLVLSSMIIDLNSYM